MRRQERKNYLPVAALRGLPLPAFGSDWPGSFATRKHDHPLPHVPMLTPEVWEHYFPRLNSVLPPVAAAERSHLPAVAWKRRHLNQAVGSLHPRPTASAQWCRPAGSFRRLRQAPSANVDLSEPRRRAEELSQPRSEELSQPRRGVAQKQNYRAHARERQGGVSDRKLGLRPKWLRISCRDHAHEDARSPPKIA